jgi:murein L,D-transpeptidase YcbB/YkuD
MAWIKDKVFKNADDFIKWLDENFGDYISKHINENHVHHTWKPNHSNYPKYSTLELHQNMRHSHVDGNGWDDIAQTITIGKDGYIVLGRDIREVPVSALGHNGTKDLHPFAYEMIGNFDKGNDKLEGKQLDSAIKISRYFYKKGKGIKFHRELLLPNGKVPKTCPGTGIEKDWFMSLVKAEVKKPAVNPTPKKKYILPEGILDRTDKGERVKQLQIALTAAGFSTKGTDGIFGNNTENALKNFQKKYALPADGIYGPKTKLALNKKLNS